MSTHGSSSRFGGRARFVGALTAGLLSTPALPGWGGASVSAQPCPDVQVVFARGTGEAPGLGPTGQAFVDSLRSRIGARTLDVYPVDYPASDQWATGINGVADAANHVISTAANCPRTDIVLGGFSQGAAVVGFVTSDAVPAGIDPTAAPKPLPPEVAKHVAAVVLFGAPNQRAMNFLGQPQLTIGPEYAAKTIKVCATGDPVCSDGLNFAAHDGYATSAAMIDKGANFAARRLDETPAGPR